VPLVVYLDESGDLGFECGSKFFIIVALAAHNRKELAHCVKRVRQRKLKKNPPAELKAFRAIVDMRGDLIARVDFDKYIRQTVGDIKISHVESQNGDLLQVTDFVAWSIHRRYESNDKRFYDLISGKIRSEILWN
jgi:hypothetical protein